MSTVESVLLMLLVIDAVALAVLVMLQQGKGADAGAAFGSGSANTVFGSAGSANFLTKLTVWLSIGFFAICFGLAYLASQRAGLSLEEGIPQLPSTVEAVEQVQGQSSEQTEAPAVELPELTPEAESVDSDLPDV